MCRMLAYLGKPICIERLLYEPDNSFIKQTYQPRHMSHLLNLAGFGVVAWEAESYDSKLPFIYKTTQLPFYDENLWHLSKKINPHCFLGHVRGVSYNENQVISPQNVHPFIYEGTDIALAHNGVLVDFEKMKYDLLDYVDDEYKSQIHGTTDTEWIYAVILTQLGRKAINNETLIEAILETLKILKKIREKRNLAIASPVNLFLTNGEYIAATRFVFDYGWAPFEAPASTHFAYHSLWYTYGDMYGLYDQQYKMKWQGKKSSLILASEPLTQDTTTWIEVPEYTIIVAKNEVDEVKIVSRDIIL